MDPKDRLRKVLRNYFSFTASAQWLFPIGATAVTFESQPLPVCYSTLSLQPIEIRFIPTFLKLPIPYSYSH